MHEFWYDYIKEKYNYEVRLCSIFTTSFIINIKTDDFYGDVSKAVKGKLDVQEKI